jgi:poly(A) polymerase
LLLDVPQSRLFDEMLKLLQTGHALASVEQLKAVGLDSGIYPLLDVVVQRAADPFVRTALEDTDRRVGEGKPVVASFLLACVLWSDVRQGWAKRLKARPNQRPMPTSQALQEAVDEVFESRIGDVSGRGKLGADMRDIWMMQLRFDKRVGNGPHSLVEQPRFRAGFDFMRLRASTGEIDASLADWWEDFQHASDAERDEMIEAQRRQPVAKSARRKADAVEEANEGEYNDAEPTSGEDAPAKKRRRRRRKPGSASGDASPAAE